MWQGDVVVGRHRPRNYQQGADRRKPGTTAPVGEKTVVADAMEAVGQSMEQEPANKLVGSQSHMLLGIAMPIVAPTEGDGCIAHADGTTVGDSDAVGVAAQIGENMRR